MGKINQVNKDNILKIDINKQYKAKIEDVKYFNESLFINKFRKAAKLTNYIISYYKGSNKDNNELSFYDVSFNNIICFSGDRGSGKTSCMLSFVDALINKRKNDFFGEYDEIKNSRFVETKTIDPALFEDNGNILDIIIAGMFSNFKEHVNNITGNNDQEAKRELLKLFDDVYENLRMISEKDEAISNLDAIDALTKMANSSTLRKDIRDLIDKYLEYVNEDGKDKKFLIVSIDDLDLEPKYAYDMVEQIRKYLMLPNVIIFIALNIEQLSDIIERDKSNEIKNVSDKYHKGIRNIDDLLPTTRTEQYIEKLFPEDRRIYMPSGDELRNTGFEIIDSAKAGGEDCSVRFKSDSVESGIRELIISRTGMLFTNDNYSISPIVPTSIRSIVNLTIWLFHMESCYLTTREIVRELCKKYEINITNSKNYMEEKYDNRLRELFNLIYAENKKTQLEILENLIKKFQGNKDDDYNLKFLEELKNKIESEDKENSTNTEKGNEKYKKSSPKIKELQDKLLHKIDKEHVAKARENRTRFMYYFRQNWMKSHLKREHLDIIEEWLSVEEHKKNKFMVISLENILDIRSKDRNLKEIGYGNKENENTDCELKNKGLTERVNEYLKVVYEDNNPTNVSFGDLLFVLHRAENVVTDKYIRNLIFTIKVYYSYLFYEYYIEYKNMKEFKKDDLPKYFHIAGSSLYNPIDYKLIDGNAHVTTMFYGEFVNRLIKPFFEEEKVKKLIDNYIDGDSIKDKKDKENVFKEIYSKIKVDKNLGNASEEANNASEEANNASEEANNASEEANNASEDSNNASEESNNASDDNNKNKKEKEQKEDKEIIEILYIIEIIHYFITAYRAVDEVKRYEEECYYLTKFDIVSPRKFARFDILGFWLNSTKGKYILQNIFYKEEKYSLYNLLSMIKEYKMFCSNKENMYIPFFDRKVSGEKGIEIKRYFDFYMGNVETLEKMLRKDFKMYNSCDNEYMILNKLKNFLDQMKKMPIVDEPFKIKNLEHSEFIEKASKIFENEVLKEYLHLTNNNSEIHKE